ncbi:MAG: hypothetical protein HY619_01030 [Thaumarchaeota archaeon]|nr:hypothetical protein [Nitrososphaerota archaeon]
MRRFRKPVTMIQGLPEHGNGLRQIARSLKQSLATGGTAKDGLIILQGDHRQRMKDELSKLGFSEDLVELH